jgi:hypothetical protein
VIAAVAEELHDGHADQDVVVSRTRMVLMVAGLLSRSGIVMPGYCLRDD